LAWWFLIAEALGAFFFNDLAEALGLRTRGAERGEAQGVRGGGGVWGAWGAEQAGGWDIEVCACDCWQVGSLDFTGIVAGRKTQEEAEAAERAEAEWKRKEEEAKKAKDEAAREEKRKQEEEKKKKLADEKAARERKVQEEVERKKAQQAKHVQEEAAAAAAAAAQGERQTQETLVAADELKEAPSVDVSTAVESVGEYGDERWAGDGVRE
jgi:flagellar biosynthesis GTPase FlhF